nr:hemagglutinin repeat-containing protein [Pseudomonas sp. ICMP22404]
MSFTGTGLDNTGGQLIGNAAVTLDLLGALTNTDGKLASAGPLRVERATQITNQGGQIASQGLLTLLTAGLDNRNRGTVAANDQLTLTSSGTVQNDADGLIYSQNGAVQIDAASLTNGKGTVQSQGAMTLTVANDIDNQSGRLQAKAGDLMVVARNLDNRGGVLASLQGLLTTQLSGVLKNGYDLNNNRQGGITQAQRLNLIALGGLDNYGGRISAQTGDASVTTRNFDNRNGGLYAKGKVSVTANDFDNSGDNDGQIAGSQIDLNLTGGLNNRLGIIESDSTLAIKAASLDNQTGQLRALGVGGKTDFQIGGLFDNRNGTLETANTDLTLGAASFLNTAGSLLHIGTGLFDISTANLNNAGGNFVTRGGLTLTADNWTNSSVIQAGRLTVNVNNLTQTSTGQLLASTSLVGSGGNWSNDGLIASDGGINLALGGSYGGSGRLSSLGGIDLTAAQLNLSASSSIAGGDDSTVKVGGQLTNAGRLTSNTNLTVQAGSLINSGTLGSARNLVLKTPSLLNDRGLVFSGSDMTLGVSNFTNQHGDLYGLGNVVIAGYGGAPRASGVYNISGSMESGGGFTINADAFENRTEGAVMSGDRKLVSGVIAGSCGDCVGDIYSIYIMARETFQSTDSDTSASAVLNVGKDFTFQGGSFLNSKSTVAAGGNINITADTLKNIGAKSGTIERTTSYVFDLTDGGTGRFFSNVVMPYNQRNNPDFPNVYYVVVGSPIRKAIPESAEDIDVEGNSIPVVQLKDTETGEVVSERRYGRGLSGLSYGFETSTPSLYDPNNLLELPSQLTQYTPQSVVEVAVDNTGAIGTATGRNAIIQAGGNVSITAAKDLENSVIHEDYGSSGGTNKVVDTKVAGTTTAVVRINSQLPPDLAQQQVNPLTLPGFSLPTGENGLFRLSGIGKGDSVGPSPTWTIGGGAVTAQDHLVAAINGGVRDLVIDTSVAPSGSTHTVDTLSPTPAAPQVTANGPATRVTGLPNTMAPSNAHKYLIETNPVLTELKSFMSSDYLLQNLGYDPDQSAKRLGDGLYEQRLIQQAVVARTGQRFIDGQTTDEGLFKYLMNNAVASKQALGLSVGVTLTSAQVAALTHDIVWLEEYEVNGEKVLVPVLYMAQANNRLAANGALIQGGDVTLIAGQDLKNSGTLRATDNLTAKAGNDIVNSGLIEAGNRLDLLAGNNIVNKSGGIISGRDVSLTATQGDVINQRDVTGIDVRFGGAGFNHHDYLDSAARIEAANDLQINAGRDINNIGGVLQSGRDLGLSAGRDVNITSIQDRTTVALGNSFLDQTIKHYGAQVTSGRDLYIDAARDVTAIASRLDAKRDLDIIADNDLTISSAANSSDFVVRGKRSANESHSVTQQSSVIDVGRDITLSSGNDLGVIASRIKAGGDVSLDADQDVIIASAQDEASSYYYKKKKGSFGRSKTTEKQSYSSTNVASVIEAGRGLTVNTSVDGDGNVSLNGGQNVTVMGSELKAGNDLIVGATQDVAVLSATEESGAYSKKTKTGLFGLSKSGKSQLQTNVTQVGSELSAANDVVVVAGHDIAMQASEITAKNNAELHAGLVDKTGDIDLTAADNQSYSRTEEYKKKVGLSLKDTVGLFAGTPGAGADITLSSSQKKGREVVSSTGVGSQISAGNDAVLDAAQDINIVGSGISADRNATLNAGRDVNILAGTNTHRSNSWKTDKSFGIKQDVDANGYTTFVGNETVKKGRDTDGNTAAGSLVDAGHDVRIDAGRNINQLGSDLQADNDIKLKAIHDINILAVDERTRVTTTESVKRTGTTTTVAYNFGKTMDTLGDSGKGEDGVSKTSSVLKTVDALDQFFSGPKFDGHVGSSSTSERQTQTSVSNRSSSLSAGNDISLEAGNDVSVSGGRFDSGRDINVSGRNITLDVAHGAQSTDSDQTYSKGGVKGGTTGGFKLGVGISNAGSQDESTQGTSTATQLNAVGDIFLKAKNDLTLIGTEATAGKDIKLKADNDLKILSAQNASSSESNRRSWGGEGGLILGQDGIGVYGSANIGLGNLEREGVQQQEAYLYAGNQLNFESGRDTTVAGATLRGDEVIGDVGRNLTVTSVPNTGKVEGKEFDASLTVAVSYGVTVSGSVGYGQTNGKTNWVENQTVISGANKVDIRTENHTQLDGAVLAADNGNLKLDTGTLGSRDITGKDNERGYYLNVGGSYNMGSGSQADKPNKGMEGKEKNSWSVEGYNYNKDREQILRATVGEGEIVVRDDKVTGVDSTAGLNRDVSKAYEVTRDEEHRTELYASSTSVDAVLNPTKTLDRWEKNVENYGENSLESLHVLTDLLFGAANIAVGNSFDDASKVTVVRAFKRQLGSRDAERREAAAEDALRGITKGAETPEVQALAKKIADIAGQNPDQAYGMLVLLQRLQNPHPEVSNFGPLPLVAGGAIAALGAALLSTESSPQNQENMRVAANSVVASLDEAGYTGQQQLSLSAELWLFIFKTTFPVHLLDPKYGILPNPSVDNDALHPVSIGDGVDLPSSPGSTDGSPIVEGGGTSYTNPSVDNPSPGILYSLPWGQSAAEFEKSLVNLPYDERVAVVKSRGRELAKALGWKKDNRLTRINDRDVYTMGDGFLYALDTQHGRLEQVNGKTGKHISEFYFDLVAVPDSKDASGGHDLRVK